MTVATVGFWKVVSYWARQPLVAAVLVTALLLAGCGHDPGRATATAGPLGQVRGQVVEVVGRGLNQVETLRVRDAEGKVWTFTTEGFVGFSPSHLREHQLFGQTVLVSYVKKGNKLVAVEITD